jgi:hypothetical protein
VLVDSQLMAAESILDAKLDPCHGRQRIKLKGILIESP